MLLVSIQQKLMVTWFAPAIRKLLLKGIVHFEKKCWYVLAYLKGIQDVGVFVSAVIWIFLGQTVCVYQSYNGGLWSPQRSPN